MAQAPRLRDIDSAARMDLLRTVFWLGPAAFVMLSAVEYLLMGGGPLFLFLLLLNIPVIAALIWIVLRLTGRVAALWVDTVLGAGNITPAPSFSAQEALIMQGRYQEAAASFRAHLAAAPADLDAKLALADLHRLHLDDPAGAERLYLEVRAGSPTARQDVTASNQLIDLYRATAQRGRLLAELARFADRYAGTRAGRDARRLLRELKAEAREPAD